MIEQQTAQLLKVLSGPHAGATIPLSPGDLEIGRSEHCDVILNDSSMAPRHARLTISANGITLTPLAQPTTIGGQPVFDTLVELPRLMPVALGSSLFAVGNEDDNWAPLLSPSPSRAHPVDASLGATAATTRTSKPRRAYSVGAGLLLVACALLVVTAANTKPIGQTELLDAPIARVEQILADLEMRELTTTADAGGIVKIQGYVPGNSDKRLLATALQPLGNRTRLSVWPSDEIVKSVENTLRELNINTVNVLGTDAGNVALQGYVEPGIDWGGVKEILQTDISGVSAIRDENVASLDDRLQDLRERLAAHALGGKIQLAKGNGKIIVMGALSPTDNEQWRSVAAAFRRNFGERPALQVAVNQAPDLKLAIRGVSIGIAPFITTQDGGKFMEGSTLINGYVVKSIKPDRLILAKNNRTTVYYLGGD